ncbi:MAG: 4-(cytidine 5'-diphospho)-2-C-methyl-D-erythritol kinase, partial [Pseudomonadota bacterium]
MTTDKTVVQRTAHAKINLSLHVTGKRADGYHLLDSLVGFAAFGDLITVQAANHDAFALQGPLAKALADEPPENNLVLRARDWLRAQSGEPRPPVRVTLDKHLPTASGIGGGSADAAATLIALAKIWCTPADILADSAAIAEALGADVPMCVHQTPLRVTGIGEVLAPWHRLPTLPLVLVNPGDAVSTPDVFNALTKPDNDALHAMPPAAW